MNRGVDFNHEQPQIGTRPAHTGLKLTVLMAAGIVTGFAAMMVTSEIYKNSLLTRADTIAATLDTKHIVNLKDPAKHTASRADENYVRDKLVRTKAVNGDARFVYVMARQPNGTVYFLADSEPVSSRDYSPWGQTYPEATNGLKRLFNGGRKFVEGPSRDSYGTWLSALVPVLNDQNSGQVVAVVGVDVPATSYNLLLLITGGLPLLLSILASIIVYIRHQVRRRRQENIQFRAEMISIASHELRTPLTGLRWSQESLMSHKLSPENQRRTMEIMYDSTLRLQESIEDILQLAGMEAGRTKLFKKPADVRALLESIITMQRLAAEKRQIAIQFASDWPDKVEITMDSQRMKRVFHNLLSNAIKYSNPGSRVMIGYARSEDHGFIISVQDEGIGIPASEQEHVWGGFYRATNSTAKDITGTGMGLYLAREIVAQHGGKTWLESREGEGTTVYVELPADIPADGAESASPA
jgi:signal transduction histidine kinase